MIMQRPHGIYVKHFQAWDRRSKYMYVRLYHNANSDNAADFLLELCKNAPFHIKSIQVDGGSEFMGKFEETCEKLNLPLFVLPPKRPTYNGGVERGNRTMREKFYNRTNIRADTISGLRLELKQALKKYNEYRPHNALKGQTPMEYINTILPGARVSHII